MSWSNSPDSPPGSAGPGHDSVRLVRIPFRQWAFRDGGAAQWSADAALGGLVDQGGLLCDHVPGEVGGQPFAGGPGAVLGGGRVVEDRDDRFRNAVHVGRFEGRAGDAIGDQVAETARGGGDQWGARGGGFQGHDAERLVARGQYDRVGAVQPAEEVGVVELADEADGAGHAVGAGTLTEPIELGADARDGQSGAGVGLADAGEGGDGVLDALLVFEAADVEQTRRA